MTGFFIAAIATLTPLLNQQKEEIFDPAQIEVMDDNDDRDGAAVNPTAEELARMLRFGKREHQVPGPDLKPGRGSWDIQEVVIEGEIGPTRIELFPERRICPIWSNRRVVPADRALLLSPDCFTQEQHNQEQQSQEQQCQEQQSQEQHIDDALIERIRELSKDLQAPTLTYAEKTEMADLVCIAKLVKQSRVDWDERIAGDSVKNHKSSLHFFNNEMNVLSTLKGDAENNINIYTIDWDDEPAVIFVNHSFAKLHEKMAVPNVVHVFGDNFEVVDYGFAEPRVRSIEPEYLLFLRKTDDGNFEPVTGHWWGGASVRVLNK